MSQINTISTEDCWLYARYTDPKGYGRLKLNIDGKWTTFLPHRVMYENIVGPIAKGLVLDHLCRVPSCINPEHLEPVTHRINILRGIGPTAINAKKSHCIQGHILTQGNSRRICQSCNTVAKRKQRSKAV